MSRYQELIRASTRPLGETVPDGPQLISFEQLMTTHLVGSDGIPLSSDRAPAELTEGIDFRYQLCPFADSPSRVANNAEDKPVPMSGLERERLATYYRDITALAAVFRADVAQGIEGPLTGAEVGLIFGMLKYLPHYLAYRGENPVPGDQIDPKIIVASNAASGSLGALFAGVEASGKSDILALFDEPHSEQMIAASEARGTLIGEKTVCAASPRMMKGFIDTVIQGPREPVSLEVLDGILTLQELPRIARLADVIQAIDQALLQRYAMYTYIGKQKDELDGQIADVNATNKKARLKNLRISPLQARQREFDKELADYDVRLEPYMTQLHLKLNDTLGRLPKAAPPDLFRLP